MVGFSNIKESIVDIAKIKGNRRQDGIRLMEGLRPERILFRKSTQTILTAITASIPDDEGREPGEGKMIISTSFISLDCRASGAIRAKRMSIFERDVDMKESVIGFHSMNVKDRVIVEVECRCDKIRKADISHLRSISYQAKEE